MPLNIESNIAGGTQLIASQLYVNLRMQKDLDTSSLETFISND